MKTWWISAAVSLGMFAALGTGRASAQPMSPASDIGGEVRRVFATKCASCHGPEIAKPKGRFGYVLDLRRMAGNPEMVIPQRPAESELWVLVQHDEMPPPDSPQGALTSAQKELVRTWIAAGSPDASAIDLDAPSESTGLASMEMATADRLLRWLGKFHLKLMLIFGVLITAFTAHLGGLLDRGADFFSY